MQIKCPHCGRILTAPDDASATQGKCPGCKKTVDLATAERIGLNPGDVVGGDYRVDSLIGKGGMAVVYRGTQVSLDRPVAIKVLSPALARKGAFVERFQREAKVLAQLNHQNIVGVLSVGTTDDDTYFLVMEYVEGESLRDRLRREGRIPFEQAAEIVDGVAAGLEYAHRHDVLHRDIKPGNILITEEGVPKIADFGIARLVGRDTGMQQRLTLASTQMGSAHYMAPEQMKDAAAVDHRADVYALGAMFYEMLTGELPIGQFKPPSKAAPGVPMASDRIIRHALATDPGDRFDSAEQFRALVQRLAASGAPTKAGPAKPHGHARRRTRHKKSSAPAIIAIAAGVLLTILLVLLLTGGKEEPRAKQPAPPSERPERATRPSKTGKLEAAAKELFDTAFRQFQHGRFSTAQRSLDQLDGDYADTTYVRQHRSAIAQLRRDLEANLAPPEKKAPPEPAEKTAPPKAAEPEPPEKGTGQWIQLFDGKTLDGWRVVRRSRGARKDGDARVEDDTLVVEGRAGWAGVASTRDLPRDDYEIAFEAMRLPESGRFCMCVFPLADSECRLCLGDWGRKLCALGLIDGQSGPRNPTAFRMTFEAGRWYRVRLRVSCLKIETWVDGEKLIDFERTGHRFTLPRGVIPFRPLGLAAKNTTIAMRNIRLRRLGEKTETPVVAEPQVKPQEVYRKGFAALKPLWEKREYGEALTKAKEIARNGLDGVAHL